jgi:hypothetical protein
MLREVVRDGGRVLVSVGLGAAAGALYAGLVGAVHLGAYGRWDGIPPFAQGCVRVGSGLGLLGHIAWALPGEAARQRKASRSMPSGSRHPGSARSTANEEGRGRGRQPGRACDHVAGNGPPLRPGCFSRLSRGFEMPN